MLGATATLQGVGLAGVVAAAVLILCLTLTTVLVCHKRRGARVSREASALEAGQRLATGKYRGGVLRTQRAKVEPAREWAEREAAGGRGASAPLQRAAFARDCLPLDFSAADAGGAGAPRPSVERGAGAGLPQGRQQQQHRAPPAWPSHQGPRALARLGGSGGEHRPPPALPSDTLAGGRVAAAEERILRIRDAKQKRLSARAEQVSRFHDDVAGGGRRPPPARPQI